MMDIIITRYTNNVYSTFIMSKNHPVHLVKLIDGVLTTYSNSNNATVIMCWYDDKMS